jgi:predicted trehalose synthase
MSVTPVGSGHSSATQQVQQALGLRGGQPEVRNAAMGAGAKAVGITLAQLQAALASGQTLPSIAASKGVSIATLTAMMGGAVSQANSALSGAQAQQIAQRIINAPASGGPAGAAQTPTVGGH